MKGNDDGVAQAIAGDQMREGVTIRQAQTVLAMTGRITGSFVAALANEIRSIEDQLETLLKGSAQ